MVRESMLALGCVVALASASRAEPPADRNWPQWRGPLGTGAAPQARPPVSWSESESIRWKVQVPGRGTATPIVWGDRVFVQTAIATGKKVDVAESDAPEAARDSRPFSARFLDRFDVNKDGKVSRAEVPEGVLRGVFDRMVAQYRLDPDETYSREELEKRLAVPPEGDEPAAGQRPRRGGMRSARPSETHQFVLLCLDRATGKTIWQRVASEAVPHEGHHPDHGFSSHSPVTDGRHVYAYFGSRGLHCYDMEGTHKWSQDFGDMRMQNTFGEGSSPTLHGDAIIVNWDHEGESFIIALNKHTGETLWRRPREERTSWSTPLVVEHDGKAQVITTATRKIRSYDLESGELVWECAGMTRNVIPTPVSRDGIVYAISGFQGSALLAIRLGRTGDLTDSDAIVWSHHKSTPYVPSPLLYGDKLYFFASNNGILSCLDARSGRQLIEAERLSGLQGVYASPVAADGRVYLVGRNGLTLVLKDSDRVEVLASNRLDERFDASPALADRDLFLRGHEYLYCIAAAE